VPARAGGLRGEKTTFSSSDSTREMSMTRKRNPPERCIYFSVFHAEAFDRPIVSDEYETAEVADIGPIIWGVDLIDRSPRLVSAELKHGVSRQTAAKLLRQIADAIEASSESLMAAPNLANGTYDLQQRAFVNDWEGLGDDMDGEQPRVL